MAILKLKDGILYSKWYYTILLIVFASLLIGFVFSMVLKLDFSIINILLRSFFCTFTLWMGCVAIVTFSWKKFPWETMPSKHIIIEVLLIFLLLTLYFYFIASVFSYFNKSAANSVLSPLNTLKSTLEAMPLTFPLSLCCQKCHLRFIRGSLGCK